MKNVSIKFIFLIIFGFLFLYGHGQINNPSFEGPKGYALTPPGWQPCGTGSSPDTQPGSFGVKTPPSDGNSYLGMVCRGPLYSNQNLWESCQQELNNEIKTDECYLISIDVAHSNDMLAVANFTDTVSFSTPANLKIWGSDSSCQRKDLIYQTGSVDNADWTTHNFLVHPSDFNYRYIILEAYYVSLPTYFGNIIVDNIIANPSNSSITVMDTVIVTGQSIELQATAAVSYAWEPPDDLSCYTCQNPVATPKENTTYSATITNGSGCTFVELFTIWLEINIPNIFTPNGDGISDYFEIQGLTPNSRIVIFNRWGKVVYKDNDYKNNWGGDHLNDGTYFYLLNTKVKTENKIFNGFVTLLR